MEQNYERNNTYRRDFFRKNKGAFKTKTYFCSYCGAILTTKTLTVDHLMPIAKVKDKKGFSNNVKMIGCRTLLKICLINDVNSVKNLVSACKRCNSKKSSKVRLWYIRGMLGRFNSMWFLLWEVTFITFGAIILAITK